MSAAKTRRITLFVGLCALLVSACGMREGPLIVRAVSFQDLSGWEKDRPSKAVPAFLRSCGVFEKKAPRTKFKLKEAGYISDWLEICHQARQLAFHDDVQARRFFEKHFTPYEVKNSNKGLFTGYFEAALNGSLIRGGRFQTPIWARPSDLVSIDLGAFREELKGQRLMGKIENSKIVPYENRAMIAHGVLEDRADVLLWTDDPITAFFLEIQGSGRVRLEEGEGVQVGYAAQNGHPYTSIGRVLLDEGALEKPVTMAKIKEWLVRNPTRRQEILNKNASAVFFRFIEGDGPIGALGLALTPMRSMAVDRRYVPLGIPLWFTSPNHQRLVVAQDTGGAIKGHVRGDLFWGYGEAAEKGAGEMQDVGTYYLLLPRKTGQP